MSSLSGDPSGTVSPLDELYVVDDIEIWERTVSINVYSVMYLIIS